MTIGLLVTAALAGAYACAGKTGSDARLARQLVGTWRTESFGEQVLTNRSDGTARLEISLNRLAALRYGKNLQLELEWSIEDGVLRHTVVGGSPKAMVDRLTGDLGESSAYQIIEVNRKQLRLSELDDTDEQHVWKAAPQVASRR